MQNSLNAMAFKLQVILLLKEGTEKSESTVITHLAIGTDTQTTHHVVAMEKVAE